jgi:hypothetical protein
MYLRVGSHRMLCSHNACIMMKLMPSLQIRDMPPDVYKALAERARGERRSLAQQALVEIAESGHRARRHGVIDAITARLRDGKTRRVRKSPTRMVREDRER